MAKFIFTAKRRAALAKARAARKKHGKHHAKK